MEAQTWVAGRRAPLRVIRPTGVERVVAGFSEAYALDSTYRTLHHGAAYGADVLVHDALAPQIIATLGSAAGELGRERVAKIMQDISDYHASRVEAAESADEAGARLLVELRSARPRSRRTSSNRPARGTVSAPLDRLFLVGTRSDARSTPALCWRLS